MANDPSSILKGIGKFLAKGLPELIEILLTALAVKRVVKPDGSPGALTLEKEKFEEMLRSHAPRISKKDMHEAEFALLTSKLELREQRRLHDWLVTHGENQQADFCLSMVKTTCGIKALLESDGGEMKPSLDNSLQVMRNLVALRDHVEMDRAANAQNLFKPNETDYFLVKLEQFLGRRLNDLRDLSNATVQIVQDAAHAIEDHIDDAHNDRPFHWFTSIADLLVR